MALYKISQLQTKQWKYNQGNQVVAAGQINFFPKTQVVVLVYDKMASIMPHS